MLRIVESHARNFLMLTFGLVSMVALIDSLGGPTASPAVGIALGVLFGMGEGAMLARDLRVKAGDLGVDTPHPSA